MTESKGGGVWANPLVKNIQWNRKSIVNTSCLVVIPHRHSNGISIYAIRPTELILGTSVGTRLGLGGREVRGVESGHLGVHLYPPRIKADLCPADTYQIFLQKNTAKV